MTLKKFAMLAKFVLLFLLKAFCINCKAVIRDGECVFAGYRLQCVVLAFQQHIRLHLTQQGQFGSGDKIAKINLE